MKSIQGFKFIGQFNGKKMWSAVNISLMIRCGMLKMFYITSKKKLCWWDNFDSNIRFLFY